MKQVPWNKIIYDEYIRLTFMTDFQREVMDCHVAKRMSNTQIAMKLNASESAVNRALRECKDMYDDVQPYSDILPVRNLGKTEIGI